MKARARITGMAELKADLKKAQKQAPSEGEKILKRGANNIKKGAVQRARGFQHLPHIGRAIGYDVAWRSTSGSADIGFDKAKKQGPLGNVIEYGTVNNAPQPVLAPELELEAPRFEAAVEQMEQELLE